MLQLTYTTASGRKMARDVETMEEARREAARIARRIGRPVQIWGSAPRPLATVTP